MNIALIGYGKMGKTIEQVAVERGHLVKLKIDLHNLDDFNQKNFENIDAAIEFTGPHTAYNNIIKCIELGKPIVSGSTGWLNRLTDVESTCNDKQGSFIYASNFSVGVNIFFEVNKKLAELMKGKDQYDVTIKEIHHTQKKDAPSGTAITLAEHILSNNTSKSTWVNDTPTSKNQLFIKSERIDPYPGLHEVTYSSSIDEIQIIHNAHSRDGFALGAVLAAEYIAERKGIFTMKDVLGF
ncbi:MAG: 4-hydroxy-tetrahydrodipicolinate reductase [Bacteroidota bacterium]|jgi:4-hydroxy-tetrahydrodipicolinate reductase|nr:4-hydroxy-tetrahydrodipicolinate reductase [Chitinophagaceae bacterium]